MAKQTTITLVSDLSGEVATESVRFGYQGKDYEIDLTSDEAAELISVLSHHAKAGRTTGSHGTKYYKPGVEGRAPRVRTAAQMGQSQAVREWARGRGMSVSDRGRIPAHITKAYANRNDAAPVLPPSRDDRVELVDDKHVFEYLKANAIPMAGKTRGRRRELYVQHRSLTPNDKPFKFVDITGPKKRKTA